MKLFIFFYYYDESIYNFNKKDDVVNAIFVYLEAMVIVFTEKLIFIYILIKNIFCKYHLNVFLCFSYYKNSPYAIFPNFPLLPRTWVIIFPTVISQTPSF